jgi:hypothetical protein
MYKDSGNDYIYVEDHQTLSDGSSYTEEYQFIVYNKDMWIRKNYVMGSRFADFEDYELKFFDGLGFTITPGHTGQMEQTVTDWFDDEV